MRKLKLGVVLAFLLLSAGILYTRATGRLYPGLNTGVFLSAAVLLICGWYDSDTNVRSVAKLYFVPIVLLAALYRMYTFSFPASLVGIDPSGYALQISKVIATGTTNSISYNFYSDVSLSIAFPAMFGLMAELPGPEALVIYPIAMGVLIPLSIASLTFQISSRRKLRKGIVAAVIATVATVSVRFAFWPIAQTLGILYWSILLFLVVRYYQIRSKRTALLAIVFLTVLTFTHKLPLLIVSLVLAVLASVLWVREIMKRRYRSEREVGSLRRPFGAVIGLLSGVFLLLQWTYVTSFISTVVFDTANILLSDAASVAPPPPSTVPTAAVAPNPGLVGILSRRAYGLVLLPLGGLAWLYLLYTRRGKPSIRVLLVSLVVPVVLLGLSVLTGDSSSSSATPQPDRLFSFMEPVLIPFTAAVLERVSVRRWISALSVVLLVVVLVSQAYSVQVAPDHPDAPRKYLTSSEVQGKEFGYRYIDSRVHTDWYFTIAGPSGPARSDIRDRRRYQAVEETLLNRTLTRQGYEYVAYRTGVEIYRTSSGPWRLIWDPERRLNEEYSRVYTSGGLSIYKQPRGTNERD